MIGWTLTGPYLHLNFSSAEFDIPSSTNPNYMNKVADMSTVS